MPGRSTRSGGPVAQRKKAERLRVALQYLVEVGGRATRLEVWGAAQQRVPLEGDELLPNSKNQPNGEADFFWGSSMLARAGYLEKVVRGEWTVTALGADAAAHPGTAAEFLTEAGRRSREAARSED